MNTKGLHNDYFMKIVKELSIKLILKALPVYAEFSLQSAYLMNFYDTLYPYPDSILNLYLKLICFGGVFLIRYQ